MVMGKGFDKTLPGPKKSLHGANEIGISPFHFRLINGIYLPVIQKVLLNPRLSPISYPSPNTPQDQIP